MIHSRFLFIDKSGARILDRIAELIGAYGDTHSFTTDPHTRFTQLDIHGAFDDLDPVQVIDQLKAWLRSIARRERREALDAILEEISPAASYLSWEHQYTSWPGMAINDTLPKPPVSLTGLYVHSIAQLGGTSFMVGLPNENLLLMARHRTGISDTIESFPRLRAMGYTPIVVATSSFPPTPQPEHSYVASSNDDAPYSAIDVRGGYILQPPPANLSRTEAIRYFNDAYDRIVSGERMTQEQIAGAVLASKAKRVAADLREWLGQRSIHLLRVLEYQHMNARNNMRDAKNRFLSMNAEAVRLGQQIDQAKRAQSAGDEESEAMISGALKLLEKGKVTSLRVPNPGMIEAETSVLYAQDGRTGAWHEMGAYTIRIELEENTITFFNETRQVDAYAGSMQHPHVFEDGNACPGNFAEIEVDYFARKDWLSLLDFSIVFLETANTSDVAGAHVHRWPFVADPASVGLPPYPTDRTIRPFARSEDDGNREPYYDTNGFHFEWDDDFDQFLCDGVWTTDYSNVNTDSYFDTEGYDIYGYDRDGFNTEGYDRRGYDRREYDRDGFNTEGYDRDGYDLDGYDLDGYDRRGFNRNGYDVDGFDNEGYDESGYDQDGYDRDGFDSNGLTPEEAEVVS